MATAHPGKTADDYAKDYTKPELRENLKEQIKSGDKGGRPGQWSARKSQLLAHEYEAHGGGYKHAGEKNHSQKSLDQWTGEDWQTKGGSADARDGGKMHRYLPKKAWDQLSESEKAATDRKKVEGGRGGKQFVPNKQAAKAAKGAARAEGKTKGELYAAAKARGIPGRSRMSKGQLASAVGRAG